ncbi:MAG TPA: PH domain-containing protein, partial [Ktedonobacteraceae bacterium]|nr:PH domain-containing protein [Ktedonobacteraceae bacterium]
MTKKRKTKKVAEGMEVEATQGGFGEADISKPRVTEVVQDAQGHVEKLVVSKGVVFKKKVDIPADRVQAVDPKKGDQGKVTIETGPGEMDALKAVGEEELTDENAHDNGFLDQLEREIPTAEGLRDVEIINVVKQEQATAGDKLARSGELAGTTAGEAPAPKKPNFWLHVLGPGFLSGMAGNDASAVTS